MEGFAGEAHSMPNGKYMDIELTIYGEDILFIRIADDF